MKFRGYLWTCYQSPGQAIQAGLKAYNWLLVIPVPSGSRNRILVCASSGDSSKLATPKNGDWMLLQTTIARAWPPRRSRRSPHGLRKISSETGSLTLAPDGIPVTSTRLFSANGLITMSGLDVGIA